MGGVRAQKALLHSQRFEIVKEVQVVKVVLSVLLSEGDVLIDVGRAQVQSIVEWLSDWDQRGRVSLPKAIGKRVKVRFDTCNLNGIHLGAALSQGSVQSLQLVSDGLVKPTREDLIQSILHRDECIDIGSAVHLSEEVAETLGFADLLLQILNLDDLAGDHLDAGLRGLREGRDHRRWLFVRVLQFVHLSDESFSLGTIVHVWINVAERLGHVIAQGLCLLQVLLQFADLGHIGIRSVLAQNLHASQIETVRDFLVC